MPVAFLVFVGIPESSACIIQPTGAANTVGRNMAAVEAMAMAMVFKHWQRSYMGFLQLFIDFLEGCGRVRDERLMLMVRSAWPPDWTWRSR